MIKNKKIKKIVDNWGFLFDGSLGGISFKSVFFAFKQALESEKLTIFNGQIDTNHGLPRFPSKYFSNYLLYLKKVREGEMPLSFIFLSITDRCPSNCLYCYNNSSSVDENRSELSFDKIKEILVYFKENEPTVFQCCITGGEPMLRKDIIEIVRESSKNFFTFLNTSGEGFTEKHAKQLKEIGLGVLKVSLDHFDRDFVNERRGNALAFDSAISAIKIAVKNGLYTSVAAVASRRLLDKKNFLSFVYFLQELGANDLRLYPYRKSGRAIDGEYFTAEEENKLGEYQLLVNKNKKLKIKMMSMSLIESAKFFGCTAGSRQLCINSDGSVTPCPYLALSLGNINEEPIKKITNRFRECLSAPYRFCISNYLAAQGINLNNFWRDKNIKKNLELLDSVPKTALPDIYKRMVCSDCHNKNYKK
ncbi:MAG: radical SAM protein [bacterium]